MLSKRVYSVSLGKHNKSAQRKPAKHKKAPRDKTSKRSSTALLGKIYLEARRRGSGIRKKPTTHKSNYPSRHWPFVLAWSSLLTSLLLCTTTKRIWNLRQLQNRSFQSIKLNKIPRTKMIRLKGKEQKAVCESKLLSRQSYVFSSYQAIKIADFNMIGCCGNWSSIVRHCTKTSS